MREFPIYSQYQNSPNLINFTQKRANSRLFKDVNFTDDFLSITTASTEGLNNWGIILNQPRIVRSGLPYDSVFGMDTGEIITDITSYPQNFYYSNFFNVNYSPTISLSNDEYRALLLLLYDKYTTNNSLKELNEIMQRYAQRRGNPGYAIVYSTYNMNIVYEFNYIPEPYEVYLINFKDLLPAPSGVSIEIQFPEE